MAVTWVGGTALSATTGTSHAANAPASLADGDLLLAAVYARSTITPPAGWTLVATTGDFTDGTVTQRLSVYKKNSTTSGDSSASFTWSQASSDHIGVVYAAARGADSSPSSAVNAFDEVDTTFTGGLIAEPPEITATADGQIIIAFASVTDPDPAGGGGSTTIGWSSISSDPAGRLVGFYRARDTGEGQPVNINCDDDFFDAVLYGVGSISLLLDEGSPSITGHVAADSMLGTVEVLGYVAPSGLIAVDSPLGTVSVLCWHDISGAINSDGQAIYYMDLVTPGGDVRVPISSWQATLQVDAAQFVQCVVPNAGDWVDDIADATEFRITRLLTLTSGEELEYMVCQAPLDSIQYAQGTTNYSATLSGYIAERADITWPDGTERELTGISTVFTYPSGIRVRCRIDWTLQPGMQASFGATLFDVAFVQYIVNGSGEHMDVGQRVEPA